jgi:hypothetical protein
MRIVISVVAGLGLLVAAAGTVSADTQPTGGFPSEGRNDAGFGSGPHCHTNVVAGEHNPVFEAIEAFPSHTAHVQTSAVFQADPGCESD